jgi:hypothetical protein
MKERENKIKVGNKERTPNALASHASVDPWFSRLLVLLQKRYK